MRWCSGTLFWALTKPLCEERSQPKVLGGKLHDAVQMSDRIGTSHWPLRGPPFGSAGGELYTFGVLGEDVRHFGCFRCGLRGEFLMKLSSEG